jgi:predicted alpha/beta superfamily hydrolase
MSKRKRPQPPAETPAPPPQGERRYHHDFPSTFLENRRTLTVALPPGYEDHAWRCPVLYMHDGQNLFDPSEAAFGVDWRAGSTAARLIHARRIPPLIIVGIANTPARHDEYTTCYDKREKCGGRGDLYARFVLEEVKPFIDTHYRTMPQREHTAVAGSSLGGLVSLTMAQSHHPLFALCGALSPSLWWCNGRVLDDFATDHAWMRGMRFWLDMGTKEGRARGHLTPTIERTRRLASVFDAGRLVPGRDYYYSEIAGAEHNEAAWAARFDKMLLYFFAR